MPASATEPKRTGIINVCPACNNKCAFCFETGKRPPGGFPPLSEVKGLIDDLKATGTDHIMFLGGEPLLRKDVYEIIRYATALGIRMGMTTNGRLLGKRDTVRRLLDAGLRDFEISLHAVDEESFRATQVADVGAGAWASIVAGFDHLDEIVPTSNEQVSVIINSVVSNRNSAVVHRIPELIDRHFRRVTPSLRLKHLQCYPSTAMLPASDGPRRLSVLELRDLLPPVVGRWCDRFPITLATFPLCATPGFEHLSQYLGKMCSGRTTVGNVRHGGGRTIVPDCLPAQPQLSPFRATCRRCSLWMICGANIFVDGEALGDYDDLPIPATVDPVEVVVRWGYPRDRAEEAVATWAAQGLWPEADAIEREMARLCEHGLRPGAPLPGTGVVLESIDATDLRLRAGDRRGKLALVPIEEARWPLASAADLCLVASPPTPPEMARTAAAAVSRILSAAGDLAPLRRAVREAHASRRPQDYPTNIIPEVRGFVPFEKRRCRQPRAVDELEEATRAMLRPFLGERGALAGTRARIRAICGPEWHLESDAGELRVRLIPRSLASRILGTIDGVAITPVWHAGADPELAAALRTLVGLVRHSRGRARWGAAVRAFWDLNPEAGRFLARDPSGEPLPAPRALPLAGDRHGARCP